MIYGGRAGQATGVLVKDKQVLHLRRLVLEQGESIAIAACIGLRPLPCPRPRAHRPALLRQRYVRLVVGLLLWLARAHAAIGAPGSVRRQSAEQGRRSGRQPDTLRQRGPQEAAACRRGGRSVRWPRPSGRRTASSPMMACSLSCSPTRKSKRETRSPCRCLRRGSRSNCHGRSIPRASAAFIRRRRTPP